MRHGGRGHPEKLRKILESCFRGNDFILRKSGMMPEREDCGLGTRAEGCVVHILASADESDGFGNVSGYGSFGETVVDHDKGAAEDKVVGNLRKNGSRIK